MTGPLPDNSVESILLDIEGTTTPIDFVYQVLFPYARRELRRFLAQHLAGGGLRDELAGLWEEHREDERRGLGPPALGAHPGEAQADSVAAYLEWLMDRDRKATPLKSIQGQIWEEGYRAGQLCSEVFPDVPAAFARWQEQGREIGIYSSGSVLAQRLLFAHTSAGDLTGFIRHYFDTNVGAKTAPESYQRIAAAWRPAALILFVSDVTAELDAARSAGMGTALCVRPGNREAPDAAGHARIETFAAVFP